MLPFLQYIFGAILVAYVLYPINDRLIALSEGETGLQTGEIETTVHELTGQDIDFTESIGALGSELLSVLFILSAIIT